METLVRSAWTEDADDISRVIVAALRETNAKDYPPHVIEQVERNFSPAALSELMEASCSSPFASGGSSAPQALTVGS